MAGVLEMALEVSVQSWEFDEQPVPTRLENRFPVPLSPGFPRRADRQNRKLSYTDSKLSVPCSNNERHLPPCLCFRRPVVLGTAIWTMCERDILLSEYHAHIKRLAWLLKLVYSFFPVLVHLPL